MMMKNFGFVLCLILGSLSVANGASKNFCDELIESGAASAAIQKCFDDKRFGPSDYYRQSVNDKKKKQEAELLAAQQAMNDAEKLKAQQAAKKLEEEKIQSNFEFKKFSSEELSDAAFGKAFYAIKANYSHGKLQKTERLTEGDALCSFLGYEKAVKSIVSGELWEQMTPNFKVNKQGSIIVNKGFLGLGEETLKLFNDEDPGYTIRKYTEITCVKRKNKDLEDSGDALKVLTEDLTYLSTEINGKPFDPTAKINDQPRNKKEKENEQTPYGWKPEPSNGFGR